MAILGVNLEGTDRRGSLELRFHYQLGIEDPVKIVLWKRIYLSVNETSHV
jgi:hypothetical protein